MSLPVYPEDILAGALAHARAASPEEACGFVVRQCDNSLRYHPIENAADRFRVADPERWRWNSRESFVLAPAGLARLLATVERGDAALVALVHSHPEGSAELSALDRAGAIDVNGRPILPVIEQVVIGLSGRGGPAIRAYRYEAGRWAARGLALPSAEVRSRAPEEG